MENSKHYQWTVIGKEGRHLVCKCECGTISKILKYDLLHGKSKMCKSCKYNLRKGVSRPEITIHGMSDTPTQQVWTDMKRRCINPNRRGFQNYGGRGIKVCDRWLYGENNKTPFQCFLEDMGIRPSTNHQIDRIDNNGNYTPENCQWVIKENQNYNKSNTFTFDAFGKTFNLKQAEDYSGIPKTVIYARIKTHKLDPEIAMTKPVR